jgi:hypothetical protein
VKDRVSLVASRIAEIEKAFSAREIRQAVKLLEKSRSTSQVQAFLLQDRSLRQRKRTSPKRKRKPLEQERSKAVLNLERKDPEKYAVLSEFDILLRKGSVLAEVAELKRLGKSLSKTFSTKNARRDAIGKVMKVLAEKPLPEIRQVVANVLSAHKDNDGDSDYYNLAQFIITGKAPPSPQEEHRM